jgi:hypothetical protein
MDWVDQEPSEVGRRAIETLQPGGILLLHEVLEGEPDHPAPLTSFDRVAAARSVLDGLRERGLAVTAVSDLVAVGGPEKTAWFRP